MIPETLVLCAAVGGVPTRNCLDFLVLLQTAGATVQLGTALADVSLTRCLQAADAYDILQRRDDLSYVLWVDHDMHTRLDSVARMISCLNIANQSLGVDCCISGAYLNRHQDNRLAAWALKQTRFDDCNHVEVRLPDVEYPMQLYPALCGMGCLLQTRKGFMRHCDGSEHMCYPTQNHIVPIVCQSHPVHASELSQYVDVNANQDLLYWQPEDFDYCAREFDDGRPVYLAPIDWAHDCRGSLVPDLETVFPGLCELRM
jgi:hypothetical protein